MREDAALTRLSSKCSKSHMGQTGGGRGDDGGGNDDDGGNDDGDDGDDGGGNGDDHDHG